MGGDQFIYSVSQLPSLGEPLSPMSDCRQKGRHYTVKFIYNGRPNGVECMLCGLVGDLEYVRQKPCTPEKTSDKAREEEWNKLDMDHQLALAAAKDELERANSELDRQRAIELEQLHKEEANLQQLLLLEQLEVEELALASLLNKQRALRLADKMAREDCGRDADPKPALPPQPKLSSAEPDCEKEGQPPKPTAPATTSLDTLPYGH